MASYSLRVNIDPAHLAQFNKNGFKLCVASGVKAEGKVNYNIVAVTANCTPVIMVEFQDEYAIAATQETSHGEKVVLATSVQPIKFGQSYTLPKDWTDSSPNPDPSAPQDGFLFINKTPAASCVVLKKIQGEFKPIYVSTYGPLPPGKETVVPKSNVAVWFSTGSGSGEVIANFESEKVIVDFTGTTQRTVQYDASGSWVQLGA